MLELTDHVHWIDLEVKLYSQFNCVFWMNCSCFRGNFQSANKHQPRLAELRFILFSEWRLSSLSVPLVKHCFWHLSCPLDWLSLNTWKLAQHLKVTKRVLNCVLVKLFSVLEINILTVRSLYYETHCRPFIIFLSKFFNRMTNRHKHIQCLGRTLQSIV